jgi:leader peptidase (prepilin peptidase)/N-methyltransferase
VTVLYLAFAGLAGLAVGSFLNVVIYRVPAGVSIVRPASACPGCGHEIRAFDNVPLVSWLVLRGRCRDCRMPISARYPAVEVLTGAAFVATAWAFAPSWVATPVPVVLADVLELAAFTFLMAISVALAAIDIDVHRLPNSIVLPAYAVAAALLTPAAVLGGHPESLAVAGVGLIASLLFYGLLWVAKPGGMGFGDVKLAGVLGLYLGYLGWAQLIVGVAAAFVLGGIFGLVLIAFRRAGRTTAVPFGPWMLLGAWIGIVAGAPVAAGYLDYVGLG